VARQTGRDLGAAGVALLTLSGSRPAGSGAWSASSSSSVASPRRRGRWSGGSAGPVRRTSRGKTAASSRSSGTRPASTRRRASSFTLEADEAWSYDGLVAESHRGRGIHRRLARAGDEGLARGVGPPAEVARLPRPLARRAADAGGAGAPAGRVVEDRCARLGPQSQPRVTSDSAICTALVAAPLRRLSLTTQSARPRGCEESSRMRPTSTSSRPAASRGSG
jgi:hypothetical protein